MREHVNHDPLNPDYAAFVAVDWAKTKHDYCLAVTAGGGFEKGVLPHDPVKIHEWVQDLRRRFDGRKIALTIEQSKGAFINALHGYEFVDVYPINPQTAAKYRKMFTPSGAKNDPLDAASMLDLLLKHRDRLRLLRLDTAEARKLDIYCRKRREVVDRRTAAVHRLAAVLEAYYPQAIELAGHELYTPMALAFLRRWPTFESVNKARGQTLRRFYYSHNSRSESELKKRLNLAHESVPLTGDGTAGEVGQMEMECLCMEINALNKAVTRYDAEITNLFKKHPNRDVFSSFPGAGAAMAPRLAAAVGTHPDRYCDSAELQKLSGIAPIVIESNGRRITSMRIFCPKFQRQTFHEYAGCSIQFSLWAKAYYEQQRRRGASSQKAKRALAFKWIRIIYRCWQSGQPYCEETYIESLKRRRSPLIEVIQELDPKKN